MTYENKNMSNEDKEHHIEGVFF